MMNPHNGPEENRSDETNRDRARSGHDIFSQLDEDFELHLEKFPPREEGAHDLPEKHRLPPPPQSNDLWRHLSHVGLTALAGLMVVQLVKGKVEEPVREAPSSPPLPEEVRKETPSTTIPTPQERKPDLRRAPNLAFDDLATAKRLIPENVTALTFDDGPDAQYTLRVLDILDRHNAKATFFVTGASVQRHPEVLREIVKRGHEVGLHSMTHARLGTLSDEQIRWEIQETKKAIDTALGAEYHARWMRAPYGTINKGRGASEFSSKGSRVLAIANEEGLAIAHWTAETNDWRQSTTAGAIAAAIGQGDGEIVLLHDAVDARLRMTQFGENELLHRHGNNPPIHPEVVRNRETMLKGLEKGLSRLSDRGVEPKTLSGIYLK